MKITVNVDCTPEEARDFMGLPNVQPLQDAIMNEVQDKMLSGMRAMAPDSVFKNWMPGTLPAAEQFQKMFWGQFQSAMDSMSKASGAALTFNTGKDK